jgi:hypothetical protein
MEKKMSRKIKIQGKSVARDGDNVRCAYNPDRLCTSDCTAFEAPVGNQNQAMCNRGNFSIGFLQEK